MSSKAVVKADGQTPRENKPVPIPVFAELNFSHFEPANLMDLLNEEPRHYDAAKKKVEKVKVIVKNEEGEDEEEERYLSNWIQLQANSLRDLSNLIPFLEKLVVDYRDIEYLNLASNELTKIDPAICDLQNLRILLLEGNSITDIQEAKKLSGLPKLSKLTLHGNPMDNIKGYRKQMLNFMPTLRSLDTVTVTPAERKFAATYTKLNPPPKQTKKKHSED